MALKASILRFLNMQLSRFELEIIDKRHPIQRDNGNEDRLVSSKIDQSRFFKISLAVSGMSINDLAEHLGVSRVAIWRLLNGQMQSAELSRRVNQFIKSKMNDLKIVLAEEQYE